MNYTDKKILAIILPFILEIFYENLKKLSNQLVTFSFFYKKFLKITNLCHKGGHTLVKHYIYIYIYIYIYFVLDSRTEEN